MRVSTHISREMKEYFAKYNLSGLVNKLLEEVSLMSLPDMTEPKECEVFLDIHSDIYFALRRNFGARSKLISLGKILEYAYKGDILSSGLYDDFRKDTKKICNSYLVKARNSLLSAENLAPNNTQKETISAIVGMIDALSKNRRN